MGPPGRRIVLFMYITPYSLKKLVAKYNKYGSGSPLGPFTSMGSQETESSDFWVSVCSKKNVNISGSTWARNSNPELVSSATRVLITHSCPEIPGSDRPHRQSVSRL